METVTNVTPETVEAPAAPVAPTPEVTPGEPIAPAAPEPVPDTPEQVEAARQTRYQRRIDELTRQRHEALRDAEYWKHRATPPPAQDPSAVTPVGEPRPEQFDTTEAYVKALAQHEVRTLREAQIQVDAAKKRDDDAISLSVSFAPQLAKARAKYEDFDDVVNAPLFTPQTQELLYTSPHGAEIGYYLGKHPDEAAALNRLSGVAAARSLVLLEQKMETIVIKKVSSAPPPITPVIGTATVVKDPEKMTTEEWMAWDKQQRIERLKQKPL